MKNLTGSTFTHDSMEESGTAAAPSRSQGVCRLCGRETRLLLSHILPEFLLKPAYDDKHRAREHTLRQHPVADIQKRLIQKGHREKLLCTNCETRFSRYERYFASIWYGPQALRPSCGDLRGFIIQGLEYKPFKLFHLSILWRCGMSAREEFHSVRLGRHGQKIANLLLADDPGPPNEYPIGAVALVNPDTNEFMEGFVNSPISRRVEGHRVYIVAFGGCMWCYGVSSHHAPWFPRSLHPDGSLVIPVQTFDEFPITQQLVNLYAKCMLATP